MLDACRPFVKFVHRERKSGDLVLDFLEDVFVLGGVESVGVVNQDKTAAFLVKDFRSQINLLHPLEER